MNEDSQTTNQIAAAHAVINHADQTLRDSEAARRDYWQTVDEIERKYGYRINTQPTPEKYRTPAQDGR